MPIKTKKTVFTKLYIPLLVVLAYSTQAYSNTSDAKIAELERIASAHSQLFTQMQQQMSANQSDINSLRDEIDRLNYKLEQAQQQQQLLSAQFNQLIPESTNDNTALPEENQQNSMQNDGNINPQQASVGTNMTGGNVSSVEMTGNDFNDYNMAVNLVLNQKNYQQGVLQFEAFIKKYPQSDYLGNAHYWLGQSYYSLNQKNEAAANFALVVKNHADSPKASDALLKIGYILEEQGEKEKANAIFNEVINQFPGTDSANKASSKLN